MGADIIKRALSYPIKLIATNAGVNGSVVMQRVMDNIDTPYYGYNAATDKYEDLMEAGIIDPTKVVRYVIIYPAVHVAYELGRNSYRGSQVDWQQMCVTLLFYYVMFEGFCDCLVTRFLSHVVAGQVLIGERLLGGKDLPPCRRCGDGNT